MANRKEATALEAWNASIGYIPQSIYLMDDTIRANIAIVHRFMTIRNRDVIYEVGNGIVALKCKAEVFGE